MTDLFGEIQKKMQRQQSMLAHFQKKSEHAVTFNEVNIEKVKTAKPDKDKGIIVPPVNYIEDEGNHAQTG